MQTRQTNTLIIGAGPFGLSLSGYLNDLGSDHLVLGEHMGFWHNHMPEGMFLRSGIDWQFDAKGVCTMEKFVRKRGLKEESYDPLPLDVYLDYADWFTDEKSISVRPSFVERLDYSEGRYTATLQDEEKIHANNIVLAIGYMNFKKEPRRVVASVPRAWVSHTCDLVDLQSMQGKRCLIVGGRQSAFEWAALLSERGADDIQLVYRHDTPSFQTSDWSWMREAIEQTSADPKWYRNLSPEEKKKINDKFVSEGQHKLAPWLKKRIDKDHITLWPKRRFAKCRKIGEMGLEVTLDQGEVIKTDHVICATGYEVDIENVPFLSWGNILAQIETEDGYPVLNEHLQCSLPGLYATSSLAMQDFGKFFGFTIAAPTSASIIGHRLHDN